MMNFVYYKIRILMPLFLIRIIKKYFEKYALLISQMRQKFNWFFMPNKLKKLFNNKCEININLCSGPVNLKNYINVDLSSNSDLKLDLEKDLLPFPDKIVNKLVCMSAINYFKYDRASKIIKDIYRVLRPGGVVRFGVQDLNILAEKYVNNDEIFYFQTLSNGNERFPGETISDKLNYFFYGGHSGVKGKHHKYVFDYESLMNLFRKAGFELIEKKNFLDSVLPDINLIDNRPEMFFYLEAVKIDNTELFLKAKDFISQNKKNLGWQYIIKSLEIDLTHKPTLELALKTMIEEKDYDSALILLEDYLSIKKDKELMKLYKNVKISKNKCLKTDVNKYRKELRELYNDFN